MIDQALRGLLTVLAISLALGFVSRVWFARWLMGGLLAPAGRHVQTLYQLLRTPGNVSHELGHAAGYLLTGFKVTELRFWFNDPARRGYVQAGGPYAPWGRPLVARLIASPAPLLSGALALQLSARMLEVPPAVAVAFRPGPGFLPEGARLEAALVAMMGWLGAPYGPLQAAGFVVLALSLGLELAPSWEDVRSLVWPVVLLAGALFSFRYLAQWIPMAKPALSWIDRHLAMGFDWLTGPLWWALIALIGLGIVLTPVRLLLGGVRA